MALQQSSRAELDAVRVRRAEMSETLHTMQQLLASPDENDPVSWGQSVYRELSRLADDFAAHIEVTEGPGGLHQAILAGDVRLANAVEVLSTEHAQLAAAIAALVAGSSAPPTAINVAELRDRSTLVVRNLTRHRQRGADLIYEAFQTDIGGGD